MAHERIVRLAGRVGARVPDLGRNGAQGLVNLYDVLAAGLLWLHGAGGR